jgi:ligand-binding SRPBCC domain-containing protein
MKMYQLLASQFLPTDRDTAWEFLSDPKNLQRITPEHMGFQIIAGADRPMYAGQIIQYRLSPFPGISTTWVTEITHVNEGVYFVDEQRFGPYALWHHKHFICPADGGVVMEDVIDYKLPFGLAGHWMHSLVVKKQLRKIFEYRAEKLVALFGDKGKRKVALKFITL